jgi:regulator of sigma E protease
MFIGFEVPTKQRAVGPGEAAGLSVDQMWFFTSKTVETIAGIFEADKRDDISGVVGSYEVTRQTIELSTERAIYLLAIISLSLGVINLFPFLPLDGGHIFWALAEKVRGRAIPFSVMERAGFVGFVLVIALFMVGLTNDVGRLTGDGFGVR